MIRKSFCRICPSACGVLVDIDDDQISRVRGDAANPLSRGYTCSKGRAMAATRHRSDRLLHPKMRKDGVLQPVNWNEALDDLATKLRKIIDESGPDSVGIFLGGGAYFDSPAYAVAQMMRGVLGTRSYYSDTTIDMVSKLVVPEMIGGIPAMPRPDYGRCKMVIYVGTNPLVSHGHTSILASPAVRMREMTTNGEVWVLDPRRTETAAKATRHLPTRPGTDYAVLAYLVRELLCDGADWDYLRAHAQDVDGLAAAVQRFTAQHASELSGIPTADLVDFLAAIRRAGRLSVETGTGISMSPASNVTVWMSWALMIVTGSMDREGGAWSNPGMLSQLDTREIPPAPEGGWQLPGPSSRPDLRLVAGEFPCAAMPDEIESGNLRALINLSANLLTCMPGTKRVTSALEQLEVLATVEITDNATVALSTHALPARHQLERPDVALAVDILFPDVGTQYTPALVESPGDVRSYWWILLEIGRRMGLDFVPGVDSETATDDELVGMVALGARVPIDTSGEANYTVAQDREIGWLQRRADELGGWRLAPKELVGQLAELAPPPSLVLVPRRQLHHMNSRKARDRDAPCIFVSPGDAVGAGLQDGDDAVLRSPHGQLSGRVEIDPTLIRGVLTVPHAWEGQYNVNQLTSCDDIDVITGMPRFSNLPVELAKA